jgi:hypothetical protein
MIPGKIESVFELMMKTGSTCVACFFKTLGEFPTQN